MRDEKNKSSGDEFGCPNDMAPSGRCFDEGIRRPMWLRQPSIPVVRDGGWEEDEVVKPVRVAISMGFLRNHARITQLR